MNNLALFWSFFQIGMFSFGGGMAAIPLISQQVVAEHGWLTLGEFADLVTIAEMTPGPIAVNASTFVGLRIGGLLGAIIATLGCITPACCLVSILAWLYFKYQNLTYIQGVLSGLRPAIVALIASAGLSIFLLAVQSVTGLNWIGMLLFLTAFLVLRKWNLSPILVMLACGALGGLLYTWAG